MGSSQTPSVESLERAEEVLLRLKPLEAQMLERFGPVNRNVTLNEIESDAAARGI